MQDKLGNVRLDPTWLDGTTVTAAKSSKLQQYHYRKKQLTQCKSNKVAGSRSRSARLAGLSVPRAACLVSPYWMLPLGSLRRALRESLPSRRNLTPTQTRRGLQPSSLYLTPEDQESDACHLLIQNLSFLNEEICD